MLNTLAPTELKFPSVKGKPVVNPNPDAILKTRQMVSEIEAKRG